MDWKQIEAKWAAMARRCRADVNCGEVDDDVVVLRRVNKTEASKDVAVQQIVTAGIETPQERDPATTAASIPPSRRRGFPAAASLPTDRRTARLGSG